MRCLCLIPNGVARSGITEFDARYGKPTLSMQRDDTPPLIGEHLFRWSNSFLDMPYEVHILKFGQESAKNDIKAERPRINPKGNVPTLIDRDEGNANNDVLL
jgi:hypothetical protein